MLNYLHVADTMVAYVMGPGLCGNPIYTGIDAPFCSAATTGFLKAALGYLPSVFAASADAECASMFP